MRTPGSVNRNFVRGVFNMENNDLKDNLKVCVWWRECSPCDDWITFITKYLCKCVFTL